MQGRLAGGRWKVGIGYRGIELGKQNETGQLNAGWLASEGNMGSHSHFSLLVTHAQLHTRVSEREREKEM